MTRILLTGDSHLGCLKRTYDAEAGDAFKEISFAPLGRGGLCVTEFFALDQEAETVEITAEEWNKERYAKAELSGADPTLVVVSMPLNTSRIQRETAWHRFVPWQLKQDPKEVGLSSAALEEMFVQDSHYAVEFAGALKSIGVEVAVLEAPRFFENAPYLKKRRFEVSQHVEAAYRAHVSARLKAHGVPIIEQPSNTIGKTGCTLPQFDHENPNDVHHGNTAYGRLALLSVLDYAKTLQ